MKISVGSFSGMRPAVADDLLQLGEATSATNTYLQGGDLRPFNAVSSAVVALTSSSPVKSIYRYGLTGTNEAQYWFQSTSEADWVKGPVDNDTEERTYGTGLATPTYPVKTKANIATTAAPYPSTVRAMGLGKPSAAPSVAVSGTATDPADPAETVVYVVTFVTDWSEEGPPSDASAPVSWRPGQTINLTAIPTTDVASYPGNSDKDQAYTHKRIYRSATGSTGSARFLFVAQVSAATTTYDDTTATANLGESLRSRFWVEPPDSMRHLTQMANGILAGAADTTVCFCEPFVPYAWPVRYQQSVDAPVVGMKAFGQSLLVGTTRSLYVFTGSDPGQMTSERLAVPQTVASKRSMVEMMGGVVFASPDGLAYVGPSGFKMLTDGLMDRQDWQAYAPSSMHAYESNGQYVVFYDTGAVTAGLVFVFGDRPSFSKTEVYATAGFRDRGRDELYLVIDAGGTTRNVVKWDSGAASPMTWTSGVFKLESDTNISVARVNHTGTVTFKLLADGATKYGPVTVANNFAFKLPADYRSQRYQVELAGTGTVRSVELASSMKDMAGG